MKGLPQMRHTDQQKAERRASLLEPKSILLLPCAYETLNLLNRRTSEEVQAIAIAGYRGENFHMIANQKIVAAINEQIGNEFSAMLQYYAISAHFGAEALPELSAHFHKQAEEEKQHALRFIQFVIDVGARVDIPAVPAPQVAFKVAEAAVQL